MEGPVSQPCCKQKQHPPQDVFSSEAAKDNRSVLPFTLSSPPWTAMAQVTTSHRTRCFLSQLWLYRDEARGTSEDLSVLTKGMVKNLPFPDTPWALVP